MIWITVAIYGLGAAVMYPTMISWADQYTDMNEKFLTIIYNNVWYITSIVYILLYNIILVECES